MLRGVDALQKTTKVKDIEINTHIREYDKDVRKGETDNTAMKKMNKRARIYENRKYETWTRKGIYLLKENKERRYEEQLEERKYKNTVIKGCRDEYG